MSQVTTILLLAYGAGVLIGLLCTDASWPSRVGLALFWPIGPLAFVCTVAGLLLVALIAWPWAPRVAQKT